MGAPATQDKRYTYADYLTWDDGVRRELINGEIFVMSMAPPPTRTHQDVLEEMYVQAMNQIEEADGECRAYIAPFDVQLPNEGDADGDEDTVVQPDLVVMCDATKPDDRGARGAPGGIVEVLSPSTASHDLIYKRDLYERHGVPEYWLVHPQDRVALIYRLEAGGEYGGRLGTPSCWLKVGEDLPPLPDPSPETLRPLRHGRP